MKPRTYIGTDGLTHVLSDGVNDPTIVWRWLVQYAPGSYRAKRGGWVELGWMMTPEQADAHAKKPENHVAAIKRIEGSEQARIPVKAWSCPPGRGGTV